MKPKKAIKKVEEADACDNYDTVLMTPSLKEALQTLISIAEKVTEKKIFKIVNKFDWDDMTYRDLAQSIFKEITK